jgi:mono/diheme cytochrome c family protein
MDQPHNAHAADQGMDTEKLDRGRHLYLTDCARCHTVKPLDCCTPQEWKEIIPRMARITPLDQEQTDALIAYVLTARKMIGETPSPATTNAR